MKTVKNLVYNTFRSLPARSRSVGPPPKDEPATDHARSVRSCVETVKRLSSEAAARRLAATGTLPPPPARRRAPPPGGPSRLTRTRRAATSRAMVVGRAAQQRDSLARNPLRVAANDACRRNNRGTRRRSSPRLGPPWGGGAGAGAGRSRMRGRTDSLAPAGAWSGAQPHESGRKRGSRPPDRSPAARRPRGTALPAALGARRRDSLAP